MKKIIPFLCLLVSFFLSCLLLGSQDSTIQALQKRQRIFDDLFLKLHTYNHVENDLSFNVPLRNLPARFEDIDFLRFSIFQVMYIMLNNYNIKASKGFFRDQFILSVTSNLLKKICIPEWKKKRINSLQDEELLLFWQLIRNGARLACGMCGSGSVCAENSLLHNNGEALDAYSKIMLSRLCKSLMVSVKDLYLEIGLWNAAADL